MSQVLSRAVAVFDRMSVRSQIQAAFAVVLLLMAVLGGASLWALIQEDQQARELSTKWLHGVGVLAETRVAIVEARDMEVKHSRTSDRSYHSEYEEKIASSRKLVDDSLVAYQANAVAEEDTKLLADLKKAWTGYVKSSEQVIALGKQKKQQDAADISDGAAAMALDEALLMLGKLTKYNFAGGEAAAAHATTTFLKARTAVISLLAAALVLGLGMAWLITRRLYAQLGGEPRVAVQLATAVAAGDLSTPIHVSSGDSSSLMAQLAAMQHSLVSAVSSVRQGSENVASASAQIAQGNQDLSQRTEEQAGALQKTASTMDELGSTVSNNADNARQANQLAIGASEVAVKGGEVVGQVVDTMKSINESSKKIADIISVIDGIAFQTNILALNAAVEAARAGEQGRGFAVVAAEVRSLAQRSAEAAKEIKSLITASVDRVEHGTQLVDQAGQTMEEIVGAIKRVTDIVGEISSASHEQSVGVSQVGEAVSQMDRATQQNAAMVEQSASAAMSLQQQAQQLVQAVAVFKLSAVDSSAVAHAHRQAPAKPAAKAPAEPIDRRGPNRAKNVERLKPAPKSPAHQPPAQVPATQTAPATAKTGTDDWESF